jgi:hypothetical protein
MGNDRFDAFGGVAVAGAKRSQMTTPAKLYSAR